MEESLQDVINSHVKECVAKLYASQLFVGVVDSSAAIQEIISNPYKLAECCLNYPIALCLIKHELDSINEYVGIRISNAVKKMSADNGKHVSLMTVLDAIEEMIGDDLYQFIEYCMTKYEKVMTLVVESKQCLSRRYQVDLFRFAGLYSYHTLDLQVDLRGTKQVMVHTILAKKELVYFFANEHKDKPLTMKDVRSKLEGRILFHYLFVNSEYTRIVNEDEKIDWGTTGSFATYGIAKLLPEFTEKFMHSKRDYSAIGSSSGIMITLFKQFTNPRDCYASPKCLGFKFPFLENQKILREFMKKLFIVQGDGNKIPKTSLSGFEKRGKSAYSFEVLIGSKAERKQNKHIFNAFKSRNCNINLIDANFMEQHSQLKKLYTWLADIDPVRIKMTYLVDRHSSDIEDIHSRQTPSGMIDLKACNTHISDGFVRHESMLDARHKRKCDDRIRHDRRYSDKIVNLATGKLSDSDPTSKQPKSKHEIVVVHYIRNDS